MDLDVDLKKILPQNFWGLKCVVSYNLTRERGQNSLKENSPMKKVLIFPSTLDISSTFISLEDHYFFALSGCLHPFILSVSEKVNKGLQFFHSGSTLLFTDMWRIFPKTFSSEGGVKQGPVLLEVSVCSSSLAARVLLNNFLKKFYARSCL